MLYIQMSNYKNTNHQLKMTKCITGSLSQVYFRPKPCEYTIYTLIATHFRGPRMEWLLVPPPKTKSQNVASDQFCPTALRVGLSCSCRISIRFNKRDLKNFYWTKSTKFLLLAIWFWKVCSIRTWQYLVAVAAFRVRYLATCMLNTVVWVLYTDMSS